MKTIVLLFNVIIAIYLFLFANILFWGSILAVFAGVFIKHELMQNPWLLIINIFFAPFFVYVAVTFFRKTEIKYKYGLSLLIIFWLQTQIFRFFFVTNKTLEKTDLSNLIFFIVPIGIVYLTKNLSKKYPSRN